MYACICNVPFVQAERLAATMSAQSSLQANSSGDVNAANTSVGAGAGAVTWQKIKIPLKSSAESLNAAVACAVILGEVARQRALHGSVGSRTS